MEEGTTILTFHETTDVPFDPPIIVVAGVPAQVCDVCGEELVESEVAAKIRGWTSDIRYLWNRFPSRLCVEGVVIGGEPGEEGGVVRVNYSEASISPGRVSVRGEG